MAKRPTYCGYEVHRVERERRYVGTRPYSFWYLVMTGDDGQDGRVAVSVDDADRYGARVPTVDLGTP